MRKRSRSARREPPAGASSLAKAPRGSQKTHFKNRVLHGGLDPTLTTPCSWWPPRVRPWGEWGERGAGVRGSRLRAHVQGDRQPGWFPFPPASHAPGLSLPPPAFSATLLPTLGHREENEGPEGRMLAWDQSRVPWVSVRSGKGPRTLAEAPAEPGGVGGARQAQATPAAEAPSGPRRLGWF